MVKLFVTTSADNGSREDYSIIYAGYLLVSSDTLNFDEPVFDQPIKCTYSDPDPTITHNDFVAQLRQLGYTVTEVSANIIEVSS